MLAGQAEPVGLPCDRIFETPIMRPASAKLKPPSINSVSCTVFSVVQSNFVALLIRYIPIPPKALDVSTQQITLK
jgi:hypothetical protein